MKTILITGATSGIGRALALVYAEQGTRLALTGRNRERLDEVAKHCASFGADVISEAIDLLDFDRYFSWVKRVDSEGPIDLAIANAGVTAGVGFGRPRETRETAIRVITANILGAINTVDPIVSLMTPRGRGQIAFVGSLSGYRGMPFSPAYNASKAAVNNYAESLRANLYGTGVEVTLIAPGFVRTSLNVNSIFPKPLELSAERAARIIRRGLDRHARVIAFPLALAYGTRLLSMLPGNLVDYVLNRIDVDIPN